MGGSMAGPAHWYQLGRGTQTKARRWGMQAVFLDRDGVINENRPDHVKSWVEFHFLPGVPEAVARLTACGVRVFVITNQAIVNRGMVPSAVVQEINRRMVEELARHGGRVEAVAYCPHRPEEQCSCRKPQPGLLFELAATHELDLRDAVMIGDALTDVDAALAAGCRAVLVLTGRGREQVGLARMSGGGPFTVAPDLGAAIDLLLSGPAAPA